MSPQVELEIAFRLLVAAVFGALIGAEREYSRHPAGLRTMAAVSIGSCLFTSMGVYEMHTDPTRIAAQVVSGVGFLGAGAIMRSGISIHGLTTAAAIWVVAAVGMAAGFGHYILAALCSLLVVIMLIGLRGIEKRFFGHIEGNDAEDESPAK